MNKFISIMLVALVVVGGIWLYKQNGTGPATPESNIIKEEVQTSETITKEETEPVIKKEKIMQATINTNKGNITVEFFDQDAPKTVANFTKLAGEGFYDGIKFHRVIKGFMIQAGDPLTKDDTKAGLWGTGGPGYKLADEIDPKTDLYTQVGYKKGIMAMANSGPNTNGSQFFIMNEDYALPPLYTIFAKVVAGQEVVDAIASVKVGAGDRPVDAVIINSITLK
jgi:cyclophilin family peptidyl-prolyl cis-trans isomerase